MKSCCVLITSLFLTGLSPIVAEVAESVPIEVAGEELLRYQAKPLVAPKGGEKFRGSNFIHPLRTPSGFVVTDCQPGDHLHHFGLWWPWKFVEIEGRKVLCWELQKGDGLIQAVACEPTANGLLTSSQYIDRKAPGGPQPLLVETTKITVSKLRDEPAKGYLLDLEIVHRPAGDQPLIVNQYRYSGFALRGSAIWNKDNSTVLTSEGKERDSANFSQARWVRVEGETGLGGKAGVLMMSAVSNHSHPEKLRTWDKQHNGAIFINFNSVGDGPWRLEPGQDYSRHYRLFIYDGEILASQAEALWQEFAAATKKPE